MNFKQIYTNTILSALLTIVVYFFYSSEFIRESVEDFSFDLMNKFVLSSKIEQVNAPNLLLFKIDDNYLLSKELIDHNDETNYGYIFPRKYLAEFITNVDLYLEEIEKENYPKALFIDYDLSYSSDPNNKILLPDDILLLNILKKNRPYSIYLPKTLSNNFIENSTDPDIQKAIKDRKIVFVSVGLTESSDNISRRYYPFKKFLDNETKTYPLVDIELYREVTKQSTDIYKIFSQERISLIENRIIFKNYDFVEDIDGSTFIQSKWENLKIFSANYELEAIIEEDFANAIIYLGGSHSYSSDFFESSISSEQLSGIEMHANALMTLFYLDGNLKRLDLYLAIIIICFIVFFTQVIVEYLLKLNFITQVLSKKAQNNLSGSGFVIFSMGLLFFTSYWLLTNYSLWLNWMIPSLITAVAVYIVTASRFFKRKRLKGTIESILMFNVIQKIKKYIEIKLEKKEKR